MSEYQSTLPPGLIRFHQWCRPPLDPGDYTVSVSQTVKELADDPTSGGKFADDFDFSVAGPRFTLNPSEVYSVYPPKDETGDFSNSLPHVVFTRRTLPWERSMIPGRRAEDDRRPWLALLVLCADDFKTADSPKGIFPAVKSRPVGELINPDASAAYVGPQLKQTVDGATPDGLAAYEQPGDLCNTIDLPWPLFQSVAPAEADLAYLAHVREVNTDHKETLSFLADGWFSVAIANRFPQPERPGADPPVAAENRAYLVSLEGLRKYLPGSGRPPANKPVRLAVLSSWSFHCRAAFSFKSSIDRLVVRRLCVPFSAFTPEDFTNIDGLAARLRAGKDSVSAFLWSRLSLQYKRLSETADGGDDDERRAALIEELNRVLGEPLYDEARFKGAGLPKERLSKETNSLLNQSAPRGAQLARLNRLLLEQAYPSEIIAGAVRDKALLGAEPISAADHVRSAFQRGYAALNHGTRLGEKTVSWYRGPLVPLYLARETKYRFLPAADAAVRYNPLDGMMDVTYAAAFQLGRLLALQDRHFATALYAYRKGVRRQINRVLSRKRAQSLLGLAVDGAENELMNAYLDLVGEDSGGPADGWATAEFEIAKAGDGAAADGPKNSANELRLTTDFDLTIPQTVVKWLSRLLLLYRVPFANLVPDERMLPPDSMRFFYLDPGWLKSLLEGACSVGRSSARDELVDEHLRDNFLKLAIDEAPNVRTRTPAEGAGDPQPVREIPPGGVDWPQLTGFLLRSPVVGGWQGLEMRAWADGGATRALAPLRIDRLAPDIMLCIFDGKVGRIELKQPPEGMHFGAAVDGDGFRKFHLRRLSEPGAGDQLENSQTLVPLRSQPAKRVLDVSLLASNLKGTLERLGARDAKAEFTSADFGVEMVESPGRAVFDVKNHAD